MTCFEPDVLLYSKIVILYYIISLDLPFSSSLIILLISSALQSYRKILLGFEPGIKVLKLSMSSFLSGDNDLFISNNTTFNYAFIVNYE